MGIVNKSSPAYIATKAQATKAMGEVQANLQAVLDSLGNITEEQLKEIGLSILNTSNDYAPLDTGELIESSYVVSEKEGDNVTVEVGYGKDGLAPYCIYQHELYGTSYKNPTTPGTKPKFLQTATNEVENDIERILADAIKNELGL